MEAASGTPRIKVAKQGMLKEIEEWARVSHKAAAVDEEAAVPVRSAHATVGRAGMRAHVPGNITEEKQLRSTLLKLSRERFKYLADKDYQKKRFIDQQQVKARTLTQLLKSINLEQYRNKDASEMELLRKRLLHNRKMILACKMGLELRQLEHLLVREERGEEVPCPPEVRARLAAGGAMTARAAVGRRPLLEEEPEEREAGRRPDTVPVSIMKPSAADRVTMTFTP